MKLCSNCDQLVAEKITTCPSCGSEIDKGRTHIDDYRIIDVMHEGYASFLCRAVRERTSEQVMIRLFTAQSGVDRKVAKRLEEELHKLKKLPGESFVRHHAIRRSRDGLWYRISEWVDTESWGSILASGLLNDQQTALDLFHQMASVLTRLHAEGYFIPHLILNDIIAVRGEDEKLKIKVDYKLSRFFDPKLDRPGTMLKRLLNCHPDIRNQRPLDFSSDIWSLGKIFVELLTANLECTDFLARADELNIPHEFRILLKVMLAEDPDLRPRSMAEVAESLSRIKAEAQQVETRPRIQAAEAPSWIIKGLQKRVRILAAVVIVLGAAIGWSWFQFAKEKEDAGTMLEEIANQYARSVAFVLAEYWLKVDNEKMYHNVTEGTAFLVDANGYLLTNRHVACPWLEDRTLFAAIQHFRNLNKTPQFEYRIFLWFEGERAFHRVGDLIPGADLSDMYFIKTAFSTESTPRLTIAGVAKPPVRTLQMMTSPLRNDFAVLKIESVPEGLKPLPLDMHMDPQKIPKLSRVLALGFPLGRRTQDTSVNVSVTSGHVRRSFKNLLQVDAALHGGNSGGPIIDKRGQVIGIVTGVTLGMARGLVPMATPLSDMGLILPINNAVEFLAELKAGRAKWNGVLDFSVDETLKKIHVSAGQGRWAEAMRLADKALAHNLQPEMVMAAGVMHFCANDMEEARHRFMQSVSMDAENSQAKLLLFIIDWLKDEKKANTFGDDLLSVDWRSNAEFEGYLVQVLEGSVDESSALKGWYDLVEKSWLYYILGLKRYKYQAWVESEALLKQAVLAAGADTWEFFLARAQIEQLHKKRRKTLQGKDQFKKLKTAREAFDQEVKDAQALKAKRLDQLTPLLMELSQTSTGVNQKADLLGKLLALEPDNHKIRVALAFYHAALEKWPQAQEAVQSFLKLEGRQNADRMSLGLLEAGVLHYQGQSEKARSILRTYAQQIPDAWFLSICENLLDKVSGASLETEAGESPEKLITAYTALGFWSEGSGDKKKAMGYYKEALESFLDTWLEYDFVKERLSRLKNPTP